jgi:hypothetical protein
MFGGSYGGVVRGGVVGGLFPVAEVFVSNAFHT